MPKPELKKFGAKIHELPEFWNRFQSVHRNPDCDQFKYLKSLKSQMMRNLRGSYLSWAMFDNMEQELPFSKKESVEIGAKPRLDRGHDIFNFKTRDGFEVRKNKSKI